LNVFIGNHHNNKLLEADLPVFVRVRPVEHQDEHYSKLLFSKIINWYENKRQKL